MASSKLDMSDRRKLALLIDNGDYHRPENKLSNSRNNVKQLGNLLKIINFRVTTLRDVGKQQMKAGVNDFTKKVGKRDIILIFFSGHGYQVNAKNYLIPVDDARIATKMDVENFAVSVESILTSLVQSNLPYVTILILDCCRPYVLKSASGASSKTDDIGLNWMEVSDGVFVQFACDTDQTVSNDLFIKHLLKNIAQVNLDVSDIFQCISDDVYRESNKKQRPWSRNKLPQHEPIYLNYVYVPSSCPLDKVDQREVSSLLKEQAELRAYYDNFPDIEDVTDRNNSNIRKAEAFTKSIISELPSGDVTERDTACHVLFNLLGEGDQGCLFFDSKRGMNLHDASKNLNDLSFEDRPFVLKLNSVEGLGSQKFEKDTQFDLRLIKTMDRMLEENKSNPIIEDILDRLCKAHNIDRKDINFKIFYNGSFNIVYTVKDLATNVFRKLVDISRKLMGQFEQFKAAKIHPLLYRPSFDISQFDTRGNKTFGDHADTYEVGPPGRAQTYTQPAGWTRYGLKVLGTYPDDEWLHPFNHPENWYRAYHGTGNAKAADFGTSDDSIDNQFASVDAASSIHENGFHLARTAYYGPGVYCSPNPLFPEAGYVGEVSLDTKHGKKTFKCMLQVAVNPDGVKMANKDIWVVENPKNIRTYGILIKEANTDNE